MEFVSTYISLDEIEILRTAMDKLNQHHNQNSTYFAGSYPRTAFAERIATFRAKAKNRDYRIEILTEERNELTSDTVAGFCVISRKPTKGKIDVLFVDEKYRGRGLGRLLINHAKAWFSEVGITEIDVTVVYGNDAAYFYRNQGFYPRSIIMTTKEE